ANKKTTDGYPWALVLRFEKLLSRSLQLEFNRDAIAHGAGLAAENAPARIPAALHTRWREDHAQSLAAEQRQGADSAHPAVREIAQMQIEFRRPPRFDRVIRAHARDGGVHLFARKDAPLGAFRLLRVLRVLGADPHRHLEQCNHTSAPLRPDQAPRPH